MVLQSLEDKFCAGLWKFLLIFLSFLHLNVPWEVAEYVGKPLQQPARKEMSFTSIQWLLHESGSGTVPTNNIDMRLLPPMQKSTALTRIIHTLL